MASLLFRLGSFAARRAWIVILGWVAAFGLAAGAFAGFGGELKSSFDIPGTASGAVVDELADKLPDTAGGTGTVVYRTRDGEAFTAQQRSEISALAASAEHLEGVATVVDPFEVTREQAEQIEELEDGQARIADGRAQLDEAQEQAAEGRAHLESAHQELTAAHRKAVDTGAPEEQIRALEEQQQTVEGRLDDLDGQLRTLDENRSDLEESAGEAGLAETLLVLADGIAVVSEDESTAIVNVAFTDSRLDLSSEVKEATLGHFEGEPVSGTSVEFSAEISQGDPQLFGTAEMIGLGIAGVVLIVTLGSALAAALPLVTALVGVGIGVAASLSFSGMVDMAAVTPVLGVMLGLAVGIDYSLFIVNRHRKQLLAAMPVHESIGVAAGTAGTAVLFAGSTVIVALLALNVTGIQFLGLMGTVGAACVAIAVLIALTLTPAVLGLVGDRLLRKSVRATVGDRHRPAGEAKPMRTLRAVLTASISVAVLLTIAVPALSMRLGLPDSSSDPQESTSFQAFDAVDEAFGPGANGPLLVAADVPDGLGDEEVLAVQVDIAETLADLAGVEAVAPIAAADDNTLLAFQVKPNEGPDSTSTAQLVEDIRALPALDGGITLGVAGQAAINIDISEAIVDVLPLYLGVVVGLSLLIMIVVFRSLLVPIIATGGFVLSLFATFGLVVALFQFGWGAELIGVQSTGPILSFLPVLLVGILFGLAMDYQLFLASGMREAYAHGTPARTAVTKGLHAGRSVVIAAALIMVAVFGGFIFSEATLVRSIGFGLAFGVLLDAFVVRLLLMPALMHLLGKSVWWLPRWLDRILPHVDIEGTSLRSRPRADGTRSKIRR
jgi:RND superfamily putative drug exporter